MYLLLDSIYSLQICFFFYVKLKTVQKTYFQAFYFALFYYLTRPSSLEYSYIFLLLCCELFSITFVHEIDFGSKFLSTLSTYQLVC